MAITRPTSDQFIEAAQKIRKSYEDIKTAKNKTINPVRIQLIDILETIHLAIEKIKKSSNCPSEDELEAICRSAWAFCFESIQLEYNKLSPERSDLYKILLEEFKKLNIDYKNLADKDKLMSLEKFYNSIFTGKENTSLFESLLKDKKIDDRDVKQKSVECIQAILKRMYEAITNIIHGVPTENAMDHHMSNMKDEYKRCKEEVKKNQSYAVSFFSMFTSENPNREFFGQLCEAISHIHIGTEDVPQDEFSRSHNIKIGLLLFIKYAIETEHWFGFRASGSGFYNACCQILNCTDIENLTDQQKAVAIAVLQTFLHDQRERQALEDYGRKNFKKENVLKFIDLKLNQIDPELTDLMNYYLNNQNKSKWPLTTTMYTVGKTLGSVLGFGTGWAAGSAASKTNYFVRPKLALGDEMTKIAVNILGKSGSHLGFLASSHIIASTTAYAAALLLQQTGKVIGGATLSAVAFPLELSFKGIQFAGQHFFGLCKEVNPELLKNVDADLVACILRLPPNIFPEEKQHRLEYITDITATHERPALRKSP